MRLRSLQSGVKISSDITINSQLESHRGIATYLASHRKYGHALVHILPDFSEDSDVSPLSTLEKAAEFYRKELNIDAECGVYEEFLYFSETFPLGEYMFEWLERRERVILKEAIKRVIGLLKTLTAAHAQGLFHGRITPKSILLERTGDAFGIRLMGLGVAQVLTKNMRFDLDWFDYSFELDGMDEIAVDIYGVAIILMGLVSGEAGIDSFESSGLLPQQFRTGILQTSMERALALRIDAYSTLLGFSQDLEAALLELDGKEGEVFVGDLVGFESAIRSVTSLTSLPALEQKESGVWSSLVDNLEGAEKSSLLCSLTSLTALPAVGDDDEGNEVTHVTSLPDPVLGLRRIHSKRTDESTSSEKRAKQSRAERSDNLSEEESTNRSNVARDDEEDENLSHAAASSDAHQAVRSSTSSPRISSPGIVLSDEASKKLAAIQDLENETEDDIGDDEAPTRVMARPNYFSISGSTKEQSASSAVLEIIDSNNRETSDSQEMKQAEDNRNAMLERVRNAVVKEGDFEVRGDFLYPEAPEESEAPAPSKTAEDKKAETTQEKVHPVDIKKSNSPSVDEIRMPANEPTVVTAAPVQKAQPPVGSMSKTQKTIIWMGVILILILVIVFLAMNLKDL